MKLRFRRKSQAEWITLFILVMPFFFFLLMDILRFPSLVKYTIDIAWIWLLPLLLHKRPKLPNLQSIRLFKIAALFFLLTLVGQIFNYISGLYYLWGIRNNIRFFVFFFACIYFINERSIEKYINFFDKLFWINFPVVLFQYFISGKEQDHLGGIFGIGKGCNGYTNIFMLIIITRSILCYLYGEEKLWRCLLKCAVALLLAALSELKMFFIELVLVVAMAMIITRFSFRKLWISVIIVLGIIAGIRLLAFVFPIYDGWFTVERIWRAATNKAGYTSSNDINRMTAVTIALNRFLPTGINKLFGLGLGNCDFAAFDFLISPFYRKYGGLNYVWFSSAFLVLETGLVGLFLYCWFFVYLYFAAGKRNKEKKAPVVYCQMAQILSAMCLVLVIYNGSLRTEAAFMLYFVLSLPFHSWENKK